MRQDYSNNTPRAICDLQVDLPLLWHQAYPCFDLSTVLELASHIGCVGFRWNCLDELVPIVAVSKPLLTKFGINRR